MLRAANQVGRRLLSFTHLLQFRVEGFLRPNAPWFDHQLDVYWQWPARLRSSFLERGVLNSLAIKDGARVLELCSGDGFNTTRFYSSRVASVIGLDADADAIAYANRLNAAPNVQFVLGDVMSDMPPGPFENIIWDSALDFFSEHDIGHILIEARNRLAPTGVLSGQVDQEEGIDYSFTKTQLPTAERLAEILSATFPHVLVRQTKDGARINYYFFCSQDEGALPFAELNNEVVVHRSSPAES